LRSAQGWLRAGLLIGAVEPAARRNDLSGASFCLFEAYFFLFQAYSGLWRRKRLILLGCGAPPRASCEPIAAHWMPSACPFEASSVPMESQVRPMRRQVNPIERQLSPVGFPVDAPGSWAPPHTYVCL